LNPFATGTEGAPPRRWANQQLAAAEPILDEESGLWVLPDADDGVSLLRFLDRAKPSLAEAAALAALVLEAVAALHAAGRPHGALDDRAVRVLLDGTVRTAGRRPVTGTAGPTGLGDVRRADVRAAAGIVAQINSAAGRPSRPLTAAEERLAARLASASDPRSLARRGPLKAAHGLEAALGGAERRQAVRQRVVALVRAVAAVDAPMAVVGAGSPAGDGAPVPGAVPARNGTASARSLPPPARRPTIWPRVWKGAAIGALVAAVLGVEVRFFGDSVQHNVHVLLSGDMRGAAAAAGPRRPGPLPVLGPATAGPVTHLELRPLEGCRAGSVCTAVVQVTVTPQDRPLDVAFGLEMVDRCRSTHEHRPGGVLSIAPRGDRAVQTVTLPLPDARGLAVVPLTTAPVTMAGTAMRLPPDDGPC